MNEHEAQSIEDRLREFNWIASGTDYDAAERPQWKLLQDALRLVDYLKPK